MARNQPIWFKKGRDEGFGHVDPEDRLKGLDSKVIEAWLNKQRRDH